MYEAFFGLRARPFAAAPQTQQYFAGGAIEHARKTLARCIERAEGVGVVIGPSGTGKTLLCQKLAEEFQGRFATALLASGRLCSRRALFQAILFELGLPYRGMEEGELRLMLIDHLSPGRQGGAGLLLLVDEAHTLPWRLIEELRMITNLVRDGQPQVRVVLFGGPRLEERLASPKLDAFSQRLAARCYLSAFNREETAAFVRHQINAAGGDPRQVFEEQALQSVYRATDGIPRLINQVCDHALMLAHLGGVKPIGATVIDEAWADLQQLPAPWSEQAAEVATSRIVEFGGLDDPHDAPEAIPFPAAAMASTAKAAERLDEIQEHLADLEDDFQPAGSIGPEVELIFCESNDPFGEHFEEEEVVLDRYASLEANVFGQRPAVTSRESRELSELLAPFVRGTSDAEFGLVGGSTAALGATTIETALPARETVVLEPAADASARREAGGIATRSVAAATTEELAPQTIALTAEMQAAAAEADDADLIVIEDEAREVPPPPSRPAPLVRRQEYRQLFAKLRRGTSV